VSTVSASPNTRARLANIPPFPPVASRLLQLLGSESVQLRPVADLISMDAAFCARVLQRANSAEFATISRITDIRHALTLIGLDRTRQITTTVLMAAYTRSTVRTEGLRRCWQHTVATAVIADQLAQASNVFTGTAYTAGIMHDVGRLGLLVAYPAEYEQVIRDAAERCLDLLDFEREQFGIDHAEAGRWLAIKWGLPEELRVVAGRHHDPCEGAELSLVGLVHVACRLADFLGYEVTKPRTALDFDSIMAELPEAVRRQVTLTPEQLRSSVEEAISAHDGDAELAPEDAGVEHDTEEPEAVAVADDDFEFVLPVVEKPVETPLTHSRILSITAAVALIVLILLLLTRN
jgi:HD-like signal output (HDOD) protein